MKCWRTRKLLSAYIDGDLSSRERDTLGDHLESCAACREELEWLRLARTALACPVFPAPPRDFTERTLERLAADTDQRRRVIFPSVTASRLAWAAVGILVLAAGGLLRLSTRSAPNPRHRDGKPIVKVLPPETSAKPVAPKTAPNPRGKLAVMEPGHTGRTLNGTRGRSSVAELVSATADEREKLLAQAQALATRGSHKEATSLLQPMLHEAQPKTAGELHVALARSYESAGRWSEALEHHAAAARLLRGYSLNSAASVASGQLLTMARSLIAEGDGKEALKKCQTLLQYLPSDSPIAGEARLLASQSFGLTGDEAIGRALLVQAPHVANDTRTNEGPGKQRQTEKAPTGPTLAEERTWGRALALIDSARRVAQDNPNSREARECYRQAKTILEQIASEDKMEPQVSDARFRLTFAQLREALGDREGAIRDYALVANNHPDTQEAEIAKQRLAGLT